MPHYLCYALSTQLASWKQPLGWSFQKAKPIVIQHWYTCSDEPTQIPRTILLDSWYTLPTLMSILVFIILTSSSYILSQQGFLQVAHKFSSCLLGLVANITHRLTGVTQWKLRQSGRLNVKQEGNQPTLCSGTLSGLGGCRHLHLRGHKGWFTDQFIMFFLLLHAK